MGSHCASTNNNILLSLWVHSCCFCDFTALCATTCSLQYIITHMERLYRCSQWFSLWREPQCKDADCVHIVTYIIVSVGRHTVYRCRLCTDAECVLSSQCSLSSYGEKHSGQVKSQCYFWQRETQCTDAKCVHTFTMLFFSGTQCTYYAECVHTFTMRIAEGNTVCRYRMC